MTQKITQEQFDEAVLSITGRPEWGIVQKGLLNDIYNTQASALDATTWDSVNQLKGFAQGLAFVINLRDTVKGAKDVEDTNAAV